VNSTSPLAAGQWYFLTATESTVGNLKTLKLYINSALVAMLVTNAPVSYDISLSGMAPEIGALDNGTWQFFHGVIDEPFVYNRELTEAEIQQIYQSGIPEPSSLLLALVGLSAVGLVARRK